MRTRPARNGWLWLLALCASLAGGVGCASDDEPTEVDEKPVRGRDEPLFAVMYEVFDDMGSNSYLGLIDSLDIDAVDTKQSREYAGGRAFLRAYNGWLFVGEPTSPTVTRYSVDARGELEEDGTIGFGRYGLDSGTIDAWSLTFISPTKAYLFDAEQGTHVVWNPTTLEITGDIEPPDEFLREGLTTDSSPGVVRGDRLYKSIFWVDFDSGSYSKEHLLAIYDVERDVLLETALETRCPAPGNLVHRDEDDNFYFSNWIWPVGATLLHDAPPSCVLRLNEGSDRFDADWSLSYAELSGGHEGGLFSYLGAGQGLVSIFDESRTSFDETTDPFDYVGSQNWKLWNVDLESGEGAPVEGIPHHAGAYTPVQLDGRSFVMVPSEGWDETQLYELADGRAEAGLSIPGWSYAFVQVR